MGKLTVAKARERAFANRVAVAHGGNPLAEKRRAKVPTFEEEADGPWRRRGRGGGPAARPRRDLETGAVATRVARVRG